MRPNLILLFSLAGASLFAQVTAQSTQSPAERQIAFANAEIAKAPAKPNLYNELAIALIHRERETSDKALFDQAQAALDKSQKLAPQNIEAQKVEVALLLGRHEFSKALALAQTINKKVPDDVTTYGYIADADIALGDYDAAEKAAQWMLDLRTHNVPGLLRGAELRDIFGDSEGALQFLNDAYQQTAPGQDEDIARILTRMAEINLSMGKLDVADGFLQKALATFPNYYRSLEVSARLRVAQKRYAEAAGLLRRRNQYFPQPASIYAEAEAQAHAGNAETAKQLYSDFERVAKAQSSGADNDDRDLISYYLAKRNPAEALRLARVAIAQMHDVWTLDSYATALYANGNYSEAETQIENAIAPGVRDGNIFYHAAQINAALKNQAAAVRYLKLSLETNPESEVSASAREMLGKFAAPEYGATTK